MVQAPKVVEHPSQHSSSRDGQAVLAIVIHATAGTDSLSWLTSNPDGVSAHALIRRDGLIYRMVPDERAAHHCGYSRLVAGGTLYARATSPGPNAVTLGVEIENLNTGRQPYPQAQLASLGWLLAEWTRRHPHARLVFHREIDTRGKVDPAGLLWPDIHRAMAPWLLAPAPTPPRAYAADSPIIAPSGMGAEQLVSALLACCYHSPYIAPDIGDLARTYHQLGVLTGVDPVVAAAQMCHETGNLTSARSQPPQRNLAGIGATGPDDPGLSFPSLDAAARAQVGRLVAYALPPEQRTPEQQALAELALSYRPLPVACQGSAPTLRELGSEPNRVDGCGWASPGPEYGRAIADVANVLMRLSR